MSVSSPAQIAAAPNVAPAGQHRPSLVLSWAKFGVIALMLMMLLALFQYPLRRVDSDSEINFNEGWNAYRQGFVQRGLPLYAAPPDLQTGETNYPPISFHLVALLAHHGDVVKTARWISFFSLLLTGLLLGMTVQELGLDSIVATFAGVLYILSITLFLPDRIGMDDPQLLAEAFCMAGLYCYVRSLSHVSNSARHGAPALPTGRVWLCSSALLFCVALFTKQNLIAFPAAVAIDLFIRARKRFLIWLGAMAVFGVGLLALTLAVDGRYFFQHFFVHRAYSWDIGLGSITHFYLLTFQGIMLVALVWTLCRWRARPLLAAAFLISNALAFALAGGDGVDLNIYFNGLAAAVLVCGVALAEIEPIQPALAESRISGAAIAAALMVGLFLCAAIRFPDRLRESHLRNQMLADDDAGFRAAVSLLKSTPGPALCESLLVCYRADKAYTYDTYTTIEEIKSGHATEDSTVPLIRSRHFAVVQLDAIGAEATANPPTLFRERSRFTPEFVDALMDNYKLALRTSRMLLFVPK